MTQSTGTIWLTQEAYDKLQAELDDLKGPKRQEIVERIAAARDEGDLKENSGYHAARDEQGKQEARIRQVEDILRRAEVGETPAFVVGQRQTGLLFGLPQDTFVRTFLSLEFSSDANPLIFIDVIFLLYPVQHQNIISPGDIAKGGVIHLSAPYFE